MSTHVKSSMYFDKDEEWKFHARMSWQPQGQGYEG